MIKVIDALVTKLAVHGMLGHLSVADPTLLHGFVGQWTLADRIAVGMDRAQALCGILIAGFLCICICCACAICVLLLFFQVLGQMRIHGIDPERQRAVIDRARDKRKENERHGHRGCQGHDGGTKEGKLNRSGDQCHPGTHLGAAVRWRQAIPSARHESRHGTTGGTDSGF